MNNTSGEIIKSKDSLYFQYAINSNKAECNLSTKKPAKEIKDNKSA